MPPPARSRCARCNRAPPGGFRKGTISTPRARLPCYRNISNNTVKAFSLLCSDPRRDQRGRFAMNPTRRGTSARVTMVTFGFRKIAPLLSSISVAREARAKLHSITTHVGVGSNGATLRERTSEDAGSPTILAVATCNVIT